MLGIICALDSELAPIIECMENTVTETVSSIVFHKGTLRGKDIVTAKCGCGKVNAAVCAQIMITRFGVDMAINTGIGGALDATLRQCDLVVGKGFVQHDFYTTPMDGAPRGFVHGPNTIVFPADKALTEKLETLSRELYPDNARTGIFATGDQFIADRDLADLLADTFGAAVCDMESAACAHVCHLAGIPFTAIRSISDGADDSQVNTYYEFEKIAARRSAELVVRLCEVL